MSTLTIFWLPILLSAVAVWIASAVAWMFVGHHKGDHIELPDENAFVAAIKSLGIAPGNYGFPNCKDRAKMKDPEFKKKWEQGPMGMLSIWRLGSMGRSMALTFVVYLVISYVIAYLLGSSGLRHGEQFMTVFKVAGTAGILGYGFAFLPNQIWFQAYPRTIVACVVDGIVYGLITGAIFAGLWPKV